jgi:hypothetical protein
MGGLTAATAADVPESIIRMQKRPLTARVSQRYVRLTCSDRYDRSINIASSPALTLGQPVPCTSSLQTIFFFQRNGAFLQRSDNYFQKARKQQQFSEHWQLFSDPALRLLWSNPPYSGYVPTSDIPKPPTPPQNGFFNPGGPVPVLPRAC